LVTSAQALGIFYLKIKVAVGTERLNGKDDGAVNGCVNAHFTKMTYLRSMQEF